MTLNEKLFSFHGRLRRRDWWLLGLGWGLVIYAVAEIAVALIFGVQHSIFLAGFAAAERMRLTHPPALVTRDLIALALAWPTLALAAKRAHDRDRSGWPAVIATLALVLTIDAPHYLGVFVHHEVFGGTTVLMATLAYAAASLGLSLYLLTTLGFLLGTPGPNRFGPSPKDEQAPPATL